MMMRTKLAHDSKGIATEQTTYLRHHAVADLRRTCRFLSFDNRIRESENKFSADAD